MNRAYAWIFLFPLAGCLSSPHVHLAAADSMEMLAASLEGVIEEYDADVDAFDRQRRDAVIEAFVARVRADPQDDEVMAAHVVAFSAALDRIDEDRRTAWSRRSAARANVETIAEIADSLRRVGVEALAANEQARQYVHVLIARASQQEAPREPQTSVRADSRKPEDAAGSKMSAKRSE